MGKKLVRGVMLVLLNSKWFHIEELDQHFENYCVIMFIKSQDVFCVEDRRAQCQTSEIPDQTQGQT